MDLKQKKTSVFIAFSILIALTFSTAASFGQTPPFDGWEITHENGKTTMSPRDESLQYTIIALTVGRETPRQVLDRMLRKEIGALKNATYLTNPATFMGISGAEIRYTETSGDATIAEFTAFRSKSGENIFSRLVYPEAKKNAYQQYRNAVSRYQADLLIGKQDLAMHVNGKGSANRTIGHSSTAGQPQPAKTATTSRRTASEIPATQPARASGGQLEIEKIMLLLDNEGGYGGYVYPVYNPYIFFKNGTVVKEPKVALEDLNLSSLTKEKAGRWGTWKRTGDQLTITWPGTTRSGKIDTSSYKWSSGKTAYPAPRGDKLNGTFSSMSGGGNIAFGGSVGTMNLNRFTFTLDGRFTTETLSGGSSDNFAGWNRQNTAGTYTLDGNTITLRFNSGDTKRLFFCYYADPARDRKVFRIAGRTYTPSTDRGKR